MGNIFILAALCITHIGGWVEGTYEASVKTLPFSTISML